MALFDGVVLLDGDEVTVILGVEEDRIRLSSGGTEIGEWQTGEYRLTAGEGDVFYVTADGDTIAFRPSRPEAFARAVGIERTPAIDATPVTTPARSTGGKHVAEEATPANLAPAPRTPSPGHCSSPWPG